MAGLRIRAAGPEDREPLRHMQSLSLRILGADHYSSGQIESFLRHVGTMDDSLLLEGTYCVAEVDGIPVACGGWSPGGASDAGARDAETGGARANVAWGSGQWESGKWAAGQWARRPKPARIRSVFVHPGWTRRGIARRILEISEAGARHAGHASIDLTASLPGVPFYRTLGYGVAGRIVWHLPDGLTFPLVRMRKCLGRLEPCSKPGTA